MQSPAPFSTLAKYTFLILLISCGRGGGDSKTQVPVASGTAASGSANSVLQATAGADTTSALGSTGNAATPGTSSGLVPPTAEAAAEAITVTARTSECARRDWPDRGQAPAGYMVGMALTYARNYCAVLRNAQDATATIAAPILPQSEETDALAHYGRSDSTAPERLRALFALLTGLGMRESTGNTTEGRDLEVTNPTAENAEAGLFQTSFDSFNVTPWFAAMKADFSADPAMCLLPQFLENVTDMQRPIVGNGPGAEYQVFVKQCPSYAANYAALMLRLERNHFGPINTQKAEIADVCLSMLQRVETIAQHVCVK